MKIKNGFIQELFLSKGILKPDLTVDEEKIKPILEAVKPGLKKYLAIQRSLNLTDVDKDILFQEMFSNFYRIDPFRSDNWKKEFYKLFADSINKNVDFKTTLHSFYTEIGAIEASFVSKLVATVNTDFPVIDSIVLKNLGLNDTFKKITKEKDIAGIADLYKCLSDSFKEFLTSKAGINIVARFNAEYPYARISDTKILDLILWQLRDKTKLS